MGFRPFFLLSGIWAAMALGLFISQLNGFLTPPDYFDMVTWHLHEMLFGFVAATLTGFLLTAIPNWTGNLPLQGGPLMALAALWLAGRVAMLLPEAVTPEIAALIDISFLIVVLLVTLREIVAGRNWRNLPIVGALGLFATGNILIHAEALDMIETDNLGQRLSLAVIVALIMLVGGRVVPSFTRNWLKKRGETGLPAGFGMPDIGTMAVTIVALGLWIATPENPVAASALVLAGLLNLWRLLRWRGWRTSAEALVWVLHAGYLWIPVGLFLLGVSHFWPSLPATGALHALTVGAIGTMTLAVMSRATLGHTGRDLYAGAGLTIVYLAVSFAAVTRVTAAMVDATTQALLWIASGAWILAFVVFVAVCGPMLALRKPGSAAR